MSTSNNNKAKPSRKPSVLVSRQFNIADHALASTGVYHHKNNQNHSNPSGDAFKKLSHATSARASIDDRSDFNHEDEPKKLIYKGRDRTPRPLIVPQQTTLDTPPKSRSNYLTGKQKKIEGQTKHLSLKTYEDIFTHFEKYRFDNDHNDDANEEILKVARENVSVPWIADVLKEMIVDRPSLCK